jgi:hypothetical protein
MINQAEQNRIFLDDMEALASRAIDYAVSAVDLPCFAP